MSLVDPRNGPEWDLPRFDGPWRAWAVASVPRSGSTLLCRTLWATRVGAPKEYLNPMQIRDWEVRLGAPHARIAHGLLRGPWVALAGRGRWTDQRLRRHLLRVRRRRTGSSGWFGLKIHHHHFRRWFLDPGREPEAFLGPIRWVRITRRDRVAQAVSWVRALQTGRWAAHQADWTTPRYDRVAIARRLRAIDAQEWAWDQWFATREAPLVLRYEDVASDPVSAARDVAHHLGLSDIELEAPDLRPQADAINAEWIARYRRESNGELR